MPLAGKEGEREKLLRSTQEKKKSLKSNFKIVAETCREWLGKCLSSFKKDNERMIDI